MAETHLIQAATSMNGCINLLMLLQLHIFQCHLVCVLQMLELCHRIFGLMFFIYVTHLYTVSKPQYTVQVDIFNNSSFSKNLLESIFT